MTEPNVDWPLEIVNPERVGLMPDRLARMDAKMQEYVDDAIVGGIITCVAREGKIGHLDLHGHLDVERCIPMSYDALFRIYSMSKPITSVAMLALFEEGHFLLNTPVFLDHLLSC